MHSEFKFKSIGTVHSCFKEKFGIPRQARLAPSAEAVIQLQATEAMRKAVRDLEPFSHIWVIFVFHESGPKWNPCVRPPRLGGSKKVGVLASRSPHRPNPIGMSAVQLDRVLPDAKGGPEIHVSGVDLLEGTPVLDIKPYLPYADSIPDARISWVTSPLPEMKINFSPEASAFCDRKALEGRPKLRSLIIEMLRMDPRPAFQAMHGSLKKKKPDATYGARLWEFDVHWKIDGDTCEVYEVVELRTPASRRASRTPAVSRKASNRSPD